jgi:hypothetical protein
MMSRDPYLYAPSHVQEERDKAMKEDPIKYATDSVIRSIDTVGEIQKGLKDLTDSYKHEINKIKILIQAYFSDEVQMDETPVGAMRRNQLRKELLEFAHK